MKSQQSAKFYVDGQFIGLTPQTIRLSPGPHKVSLLAAGHEDWARVVRLKAGQQLNLKAALKKTATP